MITVMDGNLVINTTVCEKNYIYEETMGVLAVSANLTIANSQFINAQSSYYYTQVSNNELGLMNGAFLSIGRNSTITVTDSTFSGGRGLHGGCICI